MTDGDSSILDFREVRSAQVNTWIDRGFDAQKISADFAKAGLQTAIVLNGGSLAALPPLMRGLDKAAHYWVIQDAICFAAGLILAAASVAVAYVNYSMMAATYWKRAARIAIEIDAEFLKKSPTEFPIYKAATTSENRLGHVTNWSALIAVALACGSFYCFGRGVFGFIDLAQNHFVGSP